MKKKLTLLIKYNKTYTIMINAPNRKRGAKVMPKKIKTNIADPKNQKVTSPKEKDPSEITDSPVENDFLSGTAEHALEAIVSQLNPKDLAALMKTSSFFKKKLAPNINDATESKNIAFSNSTWLKHYIKWLCINDFFEDDRYMPNIVHIKFHLSSHDCVLNPHLYHYKNFVGQFRKEKNIDRNQFQTLMHIVNGDLNSLKQLLVVNPYTHFDDQRDRKKHFIECAAILRMVFTNSELFDQTDRDLSSFASQATRYQAILNYFYDSYIKDDPRFVVSADFIGTDNNGMTRLHWAILCHQPLHESFTNERVVNFKDIHGRTPLHLAAIYDGDCEPLIRHRAAVNLTDNNSNTPLINAVSVDNFDACKLLLANGADINQRDNNNQTAFHIATRHINKKICKLMIDSGANVNLTDNAGRTMLHLTSLSCAMQLSGGQLSGIQLSEMLIKAGADVKAIDNCGDTPLQLYISFNTQINAALLELLLNAGSDPNHRNSSNETALTHAAYFCNDPAVFKLLIKHGADPAAVTVAGETALMIAEAEGNKATAQFLKETLAASPSGPAHK